MPVMVLVLGSRHACRHARIEAHDCREDEPRDLKQSVTLAWAERTEGHDRVLDFCLPIATV